MQEITKEEFLKLSNIDKVKYAIEESLKDHKRPKYNIEYWKGSSFALNNVLQCIKTLKENTSEVMTDIQIIKMSKRFCTNFTDDELCFSLEQLLKFARHLRGES